MATLTDRLDHLLGKKAAESLAEQFDIHTVEDLLRHYPMRYATQGQPLTEKAPLDGAHITIIGEVQKADLVRMKNGGWMLKAAVDTGEQRVDITFFNGQKVKHVVAVGKRAMFSGTVKYWRDRWSLSHPDYLILPQSGDATKVKTVSGGGALREMARTAKDSGSGVDMSVFEREFTPIYPASSKVQTWDILRCVRQLLDQLDPVPDPLPAEIRNEHGLVGLDEALRVVHFPDAMADVERAHDRLRFDEALALQLALAQRRYDTSLRNAPRCAPRADGIAAAFDERLPFELTAGQRAVAAEVAADIARPHPMSRLLQGEVGSGKTIVALRAMLQVVDAGLQCALLAPTEVLAAQHYRSLRTMLGPLAMAGELGSAETATKVVLLTGSMSTSAKKSALLDVVTGEAGIVIGTHALIQDNVEFFDLGMVVVDEQHRFGVEQRDALRSKAKAGTSPHLLVMTATPIPRTIAMMTLGDLETSTLRELPRGRSPIKTNVVAAREKPTWVDRAWERIAEEVAAGRQAYVVCSRIGDDDGSAKGEVPNTTSVLEMFDKLRTGPLAHVRVGLLHGRLPGDDKDATMQAFSAGEIDVLVCTTVVEVGVDVPNATVMVIVDADRFGISQLHQLRGRIGRGGNAGLCILISETSPAGGAYARLQAVAGTNDGFELSKLDLEQRREGDVLGVAQAGAQSTLRLLKLLDHGEVVEAAQRFAREIVSADPALTEHPGLATMVGSALDRDRVEFLGKT
ncbi:ATP-dependent DNA helicase RecG [Aldersonia kunmingensis]|uniref:ATP-dependent DNA helicase RecG n=1 Tax=Aldersonia kunmingensis TaxID=408066 RepID=UPI0008307F76|nr:ATP-dependent DNA helicase RecG [Aldersonia kunmingensis]